MSLYGALDASNNKPQWLTEAPPNLYSNTKTYGVSTTELANTQGKGAWVTHSGWVHVKQGTGPIQTVIITNPGSGINANGFLTVTTTSGVGANVAYFVSSNANSQLNVITSVVVAGGSGFNSAPTLSFTGANTVTPTFTVVMGGRTGRLDMETLVAQSSMNSDNAALDDIFFPGT